MRNRQPANLPAALLTVATLVLAAGCGGPAGPTGTAAGSDAPTTPDTRRAEAEQAGLAAYAGYLDALRKAESDGDPHDPRLAQYLADPLLTRVRLAIRDAKEHGAMRTGKLVSDPTVTEVSLDTVPATVQIQDCLDSTGYRLVNRETRKVVRGSAGGRHVATATAVRYADGRWLISEGAVHEEQPC